MNVDEQPEQLENDEPLSDNFEEGFDSEPTTTHDSEPELAKITAKEYQELIEKAKKIDDLEGFKKEANAKLEKSFGHIGKLMQTVEALQSKGGTQASPITEEDFDESFREDYPDLVGKMIQGLNKAQGRNTSAVMDTSSIEQMAQAIYEKQMPSQIAHLEKVIELKTLKKQHPDHLEVANSEEFKSWLKARPDDAQKIYESVDADYVSSVLDNFKNRASSQKSIRSRQLQAAVQPRSAGKTSVSMDDPFNKPFD